MIQPNSKRPAVTDIMNAVTNNPVIRGIGCFIEIRTEQNLNREHIKSYNQDNANLVNNDWQIVLEDDNVIMIDLNEHINKEQRRKLQQLEEILLAIDDQYHVIDMSLEFHFDLQTHNQHQAILDELLSR